MRHTVMNMSGIYREFPYETHWEAMAVIQMEQLQGTNCYCSSQAEEEIRERIRERPVQGIHFLDSGNYHYLSKIWMEKIQEPFILFVMDHHTDMQPSLFAELLSCGDWIEKAADTNRNLRHIYLAGPPGEDIAQIHKRHEAMLTTCSQEEIHQGGLIRMIEQMEEELPVYVSLDKDILGTEDAKTQWTQGDMTLGQMCDVLKLLKSRKTILGVDICGEGENDQSATDQEKWINCRTNERLLELLDPWFSSVTE